MSIVLVFRELPCSHTLRPKAAAPLRTKLRFHRLFELDALHRHRRGAAAD